MKHIKYDELVEAVQMGRTSTVRRALKQGRNPNYRKKGGVTLLHWAVQEGHAKIVKLLVQYGADMQSCSAGITPLFNAAGDGNLEMVQVLVELGAKVNIASLVPGTETLVRFFNPRTDHWGEHFGLDNDGVTIVPLTPIGEASARIFGFNASERLLERQALQIVGRFPTAAAQRRIRGAA